jgi:hypothetical protein
MPDKTRLALRVRTPTSQCWLQISWHPVAGRISASPAEPQRGRASEAYSLSEQLATQLQGKVLQAIDMPQVRAQRAPHAPHLPFIKHPSSFILPFRAR